MSQVGIRFAGFGGQGLLLAGIMLGKAAAILSGKQAAQTQSYGTEARGGASQCNVVISDEPITYVGVVNPDAFVCMSQEAYDRLIGDVRPGAQVYYDSEMVKIKEIKGVRQISIPSIRTAIDKLGRKIVANMVMLGALVEGTKVLDPEKVKEIIKTDVPKGTEELNVRAFEEGRRLHREVMNR